jgi:predicted AAA+ superfamily ATPase
MELLENIYDNPPFLPETLSRKIQISHKKTFIFGPRFCGKTYLIFDFLNAHNITDYLYLDLEDIKNQKIQNHLLNDFINQNKIKLLIVENYNENFIIPKVEEIIISSHQYFYLEDFHTISLMPLDFEEFIAFDSKHQSTTISFNTFLKYGNLPDILEFKEHKKVQRNNELLELLTNHPTKKEIIISLIKAIGQTHSPYHLFSNLKKEIKISKDMFYNTVAELEANHTLLLCPKYNHEKAPKKIFFYNHAFRDNVTYKKNFNNTFANMIYIELFNKSFEIYYLDGIDFYIPENSEIIIAMPFFNQLLFSNLSQKILKVLSQIDIDTISIITISNEDTIFIEDIEARVLPFYEWALGE